MIFELYLIYFIYWNLSTLINPEYVYQKINLKWKYHTKIYKKLFVICIAVLNPRKELDLKLT